MIQILSCRAETTMPDGKTVERLKCDGFSSNVGVRTLLGWSAPPIFPVGKYLLVFSGYNNKDSGWSDAATDATKCISMELPEYETIACLWPGRGLNLLESVEFHKARQNALLAAPLYADVLERMVADGSEVVLMGHSCGCWLIYNIMTMAKCSVKATIWMEAAVRQSEVSGALVGSSFGTFVNFHSRTDSALTLMQKDFVDEAGGWGNLLKAFLSKSISSSEAIVGMAGFPGAINHDFTGIIGSRHGDGKSCPETWRLTRAALNLETAK